MKPKICNKCQGTGHDTGGRPVVKIEVVRVADATTKKKHKTKKQGSGCIKCCGVGIINPECRTWKEMWKERENRQSSHD